MLSLSCSERLNRSQAEGQRQKEACSINKSLSALGDVFAALASKNPHVPHRNSKLTHLLQVCCLLYSPLVIKGIWNRHGGVVIGFQMAPFMSCS